MSRTAILVSYSGGKDSILLLDRLLREDRWDIVGLISMVTVEDQRVSMHGVPRRLLEAQATALGVPLSVIEISRFPSNAAYESALAKGLQPYRDAGVTTIAFGDLFLNDIRRYREDLCQQLGMTPVFPLWDLPTRPLAEEFVACGFQAIVCCVDARKLMAEHAGRHYDAAFLRSLPDGVDWCGEHGEFHTFVWHGPLFHTPVPVSVGAITQREDFWYAELWSETVNPPSSQGSDVHANSMSVELVHV